MPIEVESNGSVLRRKSSVERILAVSTHLLIGLLALMGVMAIGDAPVFTSRVDAALNADWPRLLDRADHYFKYGAIALAAITALVALMKLDTIVRAFTGYKEARAPIYELAESLSGIKATLESLKTTMESVQKTSDELSQQATKIKELQAAIEKTDRAVKDAVDQLADMERLAAIDSVETTAVAIEGDDGAHDLATDAWEELRALWNTNARRLDNVRSSIEDGRTRARFMRMPRKNYKKIIDALAEERYISEAARHSSLRLHTKFMAARRTKAVSSQDIGDIRKLDDALEHEFKTYERSALSTPAPPESPTIVDNQVRALV